MTYAPVALVIELHLSTHLSDWLTQRCVPSVPPLVNYFPCPAKRQRIYLKIIIFPVLTEQLFLLCAELHFHCIMNFKREVHDKSRSHPGNRFFRFPFGGEFLGTAGFPGHIEFGYGFSQTSFFSRYLKLFFCPSCHLLAGSTTDRHLFLGLIHTDCLVMQYRNQIATIIFLWYSHQELRPVYT